MVSTSPFPKLVLATRNPHKALELKQLLDHDHINIVDLTEFPDAPHVDETASSLVGNAKLKALSAQKHTNLWALGDDTGLFVEALDGAPGVRSARFAGDGADAEANRHLLLQHLADHSNRSAKFITILALALPDEMHCFEGCLNGHIAKSVMSTEGFGYESIFIPEGFDVSLSQLSKSLKNQFSHRAKSAAQVINFLIR